MSEETITFRRALETDLYSIWSILQADSQMLSEPKILEIMDQLYVLEYQKRILGVLCGNYSKNRVNISWVGIHPIFPEVALREAMICQFSAIFCREPGNNLSEFSSYNRFLKSISGQFEKIKFLIKTEGAIHGVQDQ